MQNETMKDVAKIWMLSFAAIGVIGTGIGAGILIIGTIGEAERIAATGTLSRYETELVQRPQGGVSRRYRAVVRFRREDGAYEEIVGNVQSRSRPYGIAEAIPVSYIPGVRGSGRIENFRERYQTPIVFLAVGTPFLLLCVVVAVLRRKARILHRKLQAEGIAVEARIVGVKVDEKTTIRDKHPHEIVAELERPDGTTTKVTSISYLEDPPFSTWPSPPPPPLLRDRLGRTAAPVPYMRNLSRLAVAVRDGFSL